MAQTPEDTPTIQHQLQQLRHQKRRDSKFGTAEDTSVPIPDWLEELQSKEVRTPNTQVEALTQEVNHLLDQLPIVADTHNAAAAKQFSQCVTELTKLYYVRIRLVSTKPNGDWLQEQQKKEFAQVVQRLAKALDV